MNVWKKNRKPIYSKETIIFISASQKCSQKFDGEISRSSLGIVSDCDKEIAVYLCLAPFEFSHLLLKVWLP